MAVHRFAEGTSVSVASSRAEVERLLTRYGATELGFMSSGIHRSWVIIFVANGRRVKLEVPKPNEADHKAYLRETGRRTPLLAWLEAEERRRWRVLVLRLKARLEECADDPASFDRVFLAEILTPDDRTIGEAILPMLDQAYQGQALLLPGMEKKR